MDVDEPPDAKEVGIVGSLRGAHENLTRP